MKCFVTGAGGFVGSHLIRKLVAEGHDVAGLVRPGSDAGEVKAAGARVIEGEMEWTNVFARHCEGVDVVFHLAGITRSPSTAEFREVNQHGTASLIRGLDRAEFTGRVVYLSSLSAGGPASGPQAPRIEEDSDQPVSAYGRSKRGAERLLREGLDGRANWTVLRPGTVYGPGAWRFAIELARIQRTGTVLQFHPATVLQLTHVADVIDALLRVASSPEAARRMYYVAERTQWPLTRLTELVGEALGRRLRIIKVPRRPAQLASALSDYCSKNFGTAQFAPDRSRLADLQAGCWLSDPTRIETELGWKAQHSLADGLAETIDDFRAQEWLE